MSITVSIKAIIEEKLKQFEDLPALPSVYIKLKELIERDRSTREIASLLENDQALAAKVLKLANSALFSGLKEVTDLNLAITRLGMRTIETLVLTTATGSFYVAKSPADLEILSKLWGHAAACGAAGRRLAVRIRYPDPEKAFLSCLLHDIGKAVILNAVSRLRIGGMNGAVLNHELKLELIQGFHEEIGYKLIKSWNLHEDLALCARFHSCPEQLDQPNILVNIANLANLISRKLGESLHPYANESLVDNPLAIQYEIGDLEMASMLVEIEDQMNQLKSLVAKTR